MTIYIVIILWAYLAGLYAAILLVDELGFRRTLAIWIALILWPVSLVTVRVLAFVQDLWLGVQRVLNK